MPRRDSLIEGWKYCAGPCERPLDLSHFYIRPDGHPESKCNGCRRVYERERYRRRYRKDKKFRRREIARIVAYQRRRSGKARTVGA